MVTTTPYSREMQGLVEEYRSSGEEWPATSRQIAAWAIRNRNWEAQTSRMITQCADDLSRAMREEIIRDPQGRTVRAKHAAKVLKNGTQMMLWADIRTADRGHMEAAFGLRRKQIVGDCRQLKADVDSFNDNKNEGPPIQLSFDFSLDLEELELASQPPESNVVSVLDLPLDRSVALVGAANSDAKN